MTTLIPGTCMNHASSDCACCAPKWLLPMTVVTRIGVGVAPPVMYRSFAAWFTT